MTNPEFDDFTIKVPEKCIGCYMQHGMLAAIGNLIVIKQATLATASDLIAAGDKQSSPLDLIINNVNEGDIEEILAQLRIEAENQLVGIDSTIDFVRTEMTKRAGKCSGSLELTGERDGFLYTAPVCTYLDDYKNNNGVVEQKAVNMTFRRIEE